MEHKAMRYEALIQQREAAYQSGDYEQAQYYERQLAQMQGRRSLQHQHTYEPEGRADWFDEG
ncbi:hypothetical protein VST7929_02869 [Vibrio stylophorae]|uniref:Uncharacterized protein n=1 Tax=Vibrio stylophorae TaxID=659351 RepID=A0ABN8DXV1_9VIBR|nr:hypothetical protein [Vibrio stylophorae]CAH0535208.1 hypothetical protein VST7929_02869 [Vibrio stylophorae]